MICTYLLTPKMYKVDLFRNFFIKNQKVETHYSASLL